MFLPLNNNKSFIFTVFLSTSYLTRHPSMTPHPQPISPPSHRHAAADGGDEDEGDEDEDDPEPGAYPRSVAPCANAAAAAAAAGVLGASSSVAAAPTAATAAAALPSEESAAAAKPGAGQPSLTHWPKAPLIDVPKEAKIHQGTRLFWFLVLDFVTITVKLRYSAHTSLDFPPIRHFNL